MSADTMTNNVFLNCSLAALLAAITGCAGSGPNVNATQTTVPTPLPPVSASGTIISRPSLLVGDDANTPYILVFPPTATGSPAPTAMISNARNVSTDAAGNIYVVSADGFIQQYPAGKPNATPARSIPLAAGTNPGTVVKAVSQTGEIFVSDEVGVSVYSAMANGNDLPVRYIQGNAQANGGAATAIMPGYALAVDSVDNLYMSNNGVTPIVVFGPNDSGVVVPQRAIGGDQTMLFGKAFGVFSMATDTAGNLYVSCSCGGGGAILEFAPTANGNVAPIRVISGALTLAYGGGITVDSAGYIYQSTTTNYTTQSVIRYSPSAVGNVAPDSIFTIGEWTGYDQSIAVY
jgi:hypothetical protein